MTTLLDRQRAAKLTDAMLSALDLLCRHGLLWRQAMGWGTGTAGGALIAAATMDALVERGLAAARHDIARATTDGQILHGEIIGGRS